MWMKTTFAMMSWKTALHMMSPLKEIIGTIAIEEEELVPLMDLISLPRRP
jgi:hypothetical protein